MKTTNTGPMTHRDAVWAEGGAVIIKRAGRYQTTGNNCRAWFATSYVLTVDGAIITSRRPGRGSPAKAIAELKAAAVAVRAYVAPVVVAPEDAIEYCDDCGGVEAVAYGVARWSSDDECRCGTEDDDENDARWAWQ